MNPSRPIERADRQLERLAQLREWRASGGVMHLVAQELYELELWKEDVAQVLAREGLAIEPFTEPEDRDALMGADSPDLAVAERVAELRARLNETLGDTG